MNNIEQYEMRSFFTLHRLTWERDCSSRPGIQGKRKGRRKILLHFLSSPPPGLQSKQIKKVDFEWVKKEKKKKENCDPFSSDLWVEGKKFGTKAVILCLRERCLAFIFCVNLQKVKRQFRDAVPG